MALSLRWRALLATSVAALGTIAPPPSLGGEAESLSASFRNASRRVLPAVVTVRMAGAPAPIGPIVGTPIPGLFPDRFRIDPPFRESGGSGVVIDAERGYILTNSHVVQTGAPLSVILHDGRERAVTQVRRDPKSDLALLMIQADKLSQAVWGDSDALDTGDWVLAIGQPFGLSDTVTAGIVSGKERGIGLAMYEDLIQTDAAINPGNSGGPLINLRGEVVGINTAIRTRGGGYEGVGFAIPASRARRVAAELAEHGRVRRAYLGIQIGPVDSVTLERLDQRGAVAVNGVAGDGPAAEAGLRRGDLIVQLEGQPISGLGALQAAIEVAHIGKPITLTIDRDGHRQNVTILPREQPDSFGIADRDPVGARRPAEPRAPAPAPPAENRIETTDVRFPALGLRLSEPSPELARRFRQPEKTVHGLLIVGVEPNSPADQGGLEPGMVITDVSHRKVETMADFLDALSKRPEGRELLVRILKGSKAEFRVIPEPAPAAPRGEPPAAKDAEKPKTQ